MRLFSEAIFYLNGTQQLSFFKNNELDKQCREHLLSSSAKHHPHALPFLAGCPAVGSLKTDTPSIPLFWSWLNHLFYYFLQPTSPWESAFPLAYSLDLSCSFSLSPSTLPESFSILKSKTHFSNIELKTHSILQILRSQLIKQTGVSPDPGLPIYFLLISNGNESH